MKDFLNLDIENIDFNHTALTLFKEQSVRCAPYCEYLRLIGCDVAAVERVEQIPFLPIELFKSHVVYCCQGDDNGDGSSAEALFTSSGEVSSRHYMRSLALYERSFVEAFKLFYGSPAEYSIYALLPSYLEREGSSLIYMVERLRELSGGGGGFYLYDHAQMLCDMAADPRRKILLGVTYALLDLAESGLVSEPLRDTIVMETGGMKGHRREMERTELHELLTQAFGVDKIHSEFGMAELTSQGYSYGDGVFRSPPWLKILIRDVADPRDVRASVEEGRALRGGINIVDLASQYSCAFIETQDMGQLFASGEFTVDGRITGSDRRGCNLLLE